MTTQSPFILTALAVAGLVAGSAGRLSAEEPGIVRIRDGAPLPVSSPHYAGPAAAGPIIDNGGVIYGQPGCRDCGEYDGDYDDGHGLWGGLHGLLHGHHVGRYGHHSPDHGWGRPVKWRIQRLPVLYQRYWPTAYYGQPGAGYHGAGVNYHPMVYTPTDTTQLGYYYQRVPFWRPDPTRTPPVPWPAHWHRRECSAQPFGHDYYPPFGYGDPAFGYAGYGAGAEMIDGSVSGILPATEAAPVMRDIPDSTDPPAAPVEAPPPPPIDLNQSARKLIP